MISLNQIINLAKTFLPSNSPWIEKIEQALNMSQQFQQSPQGVKDLMRSMNKSNQDVTNALSMLNNPIVSGLVNSIAPNMSNRLVEAVNQVTNTTSTHDSFRNRLSKL